MNFNLIFSFPNIGIIDKIFKFFTDNSYSNLIRLGFAILTFFLFILMRNMFTKYVLRLAKKLTDKTKFVMDSKLLEAAEGPIRAGFMIFGIYMAAVILGTDYKINMIAAHKFLRSAITILLAKILINFADDSSCFFDGIKERFGIKIDKILIPFISKSIKLIIFIFASSIVLAEWNIDIKMLVTGIGLGGLAVSLAAKDAAANIIAGITLIVEKSFDIGDYVMVNNIEGSVEEISFRSTRIRTVNKELITIPNSSIANAPIMNFTKRDMRRMNFIIGVTYDTPREKLDICIDKIKDILKSHDRINKDDIIVVFDKFNDSSLDIMISCYTIGNLLSEHLKIKEEVNFEIMDALENLGVSAAFPSRSLYLETPLSYENKKDVLDDNEVNYKNIIS